MYVSTHELFQEKVLLVEKTKVEGGALYIHACMHSMAWHAWMHGV